MLQKLFKIIYIMENQGFQTVVGFIQCSTAACSITQQVGICFNVMPECMTSYYIIKVKCVT